MKVHFSIPLDLENYELFSNISQRQLSNKTVYRENQLFSFNIDSYYGSLPYTLWNGNINNNNGNLFLYNDIEEFQYKINSPFRMDCSNIYINNKDFLNTYMNLILQFLSGCGNIIEISNFDLYNYIKEKYNNFNFIFSRNADLIYPLNEDIIEQLCEKEDIKLINLPFRFNDDFELLSQLKNKSKIEINIFNRCTNCESKKDCDIVEQQNQYNFLEYSSYNQNCNYTRYYDKNNNTEIIDVIKSYINIGINHFKIDNSIKKMKNDFYDWLLNNLFKPNFVEVLKNG